MFRRSLGWVVAVINRPFLLTIRSIAAPRWRWYGCSMGVEVSFIAAFLAGVLSISSPCVLPLVPIFLAHLAGASAGGVEGIGRRRVLPNAIAYVLGFSLVFVSLGLALNHLPAGQVTSSFLVGVTFAAGWSPCVGPILGAILTMAAGQGSIDRAALLLATYSAGLAVPFLLAAVAIGSSPNVIRGINRRLPLVTGVSGGVMVAMGAIMTLGIYQQFFARLVALSPWTPWEPAL